MIHKLWFLTCVLLTGMICYGCIQTQPLDDRKVILQQNTPTEPLWVKSPPLPDENKASYIVFQKTKIDNLSLGIKQAQAAALLLKHNQDTKLEICDVYWQQTALGATAFHETYYSVWVLVQVQNVKHIKKGTH